LITSLASHGHRTKRHSSGSRWLRTGLAAISDALLWCFDAATDARRLQSSADVPTPPSAAPTAQTVGDPEFDAFFTRFERSLFGYIRRIVPADEIAVEITQETFFRAWQHFATVRAYERPQAWLYKVATHLALNQRRDTHTITFTQYAADTGGTDAPESVIEEMLADPLDLEHQIAERDLINRVLQTLSAKHRAALLLRAVYGLSGDEITQALGMSSAAARKMLSRAREQFREIYSAAK
jgi:RNA polymerase sigma-70 factor, ECF subfamily